MRRIVMLVAVLSVALLPAVASAQTEAEITQAVEELSAAVEVLDGADAAEWAAAAAIVRAAFDNLTSLVELESSVEFEAALVGLEDAIEGGDLTAIAAEAALVAEALGAVEAEGEAAAAAAGEGEEAPEGGVATGAGGTAGPSPVALVLIGLGATAAAAFVYTRTRQPSRD